MSAIAGLMRLDGQPADQRQLERVAGALRQYGPDRTDIRISQTVGVVHALMRMTPEDRFDRQPQQGSSGALVTADARIDNRDELGAANLTFSAKTSEAGATRRIDLSIRPATPYMTQIKAGVLPRGPRDVRLDRTLYPHFRKLEELSTLRRAQPVQ